MINELKPVNCGCGGEAMLLVDMNNYSIMCRKCGISTENYDTKTEAITAWNKAMGRKTVKAELNPLEEDVVIGNTTFKIGTRVIAECECGTWLRLGYKYCPNCGCRLEWNE